MNLYDMILLLAAENQLHCLWRVCLRNNISYGHAHEIVTRAKLFGHLLSEKNCNAQGKPINFSITPLGKEYLHSKYPERITL